MIHKGKVKDHKLVIYNRELFNANVRALEGKQINILLKKASKPRNLPQNSRHWARMTLAAEILGDRTPEELHYDFRSLLLTDRTVNPPRVLSSTELTKKRFAIWEEDIDRILAEMGIVLPEEINLAIVRIW